jgi:geranylgeranyl diphosphate synthase type II
MKYECCKLAQKLVLCMPLISFRIFLLTEKQAITKEPENLYEPIAYILGIGGKRIRPVLTLMTTEVLMEIIKSTACCHGC